MWDSSEKCIISCIETLAVCIGEMCSWFENCINSSKNYFSAVTIVPKRSRKSPKPEQKLSLFFSHTKFWMFRPNSYIHLQKSKSLSVIIPTLILTLGNQNIVFISQLIQVLATENWENDHFNWHTGKSIHIFPKISHDLLQNIWSRLHDIPKEHFVYLWFPSFLVSFHPSNLLCLSNSGLWGVGTYPSYINTRDGVRIETDNCPQSHSPTIAMVPMVSWVSKSRMGTTRFNYPVPLLWTHFFSVVVVFLKGLDCL